MREILFKAKRKDNGEWVEGYYCFFMDAHCIIPQSLDTTAALLREQKVFIKVDPDTLCQYTGLKDKNGNKIWENDICILHTNSIDEEDGYFKVEYDKDNARFVLLGAALQFDFEFLREGECEVSGNIFEHPELQEYLQRYL